MHSRFRVQLVSFLAGVSLVLFLLTINSQWRHNSQVVYITETGTKYHRSQCKSLFYTSLPVSRGEAEREGYAPCKLCFSRLGAED